jgi:hypothetical protein
MVDENEKYECRSAALTTALTQAGIAAMRKIRSARTGENFDVELESTVASVLSDVSARTAAVCVSTFGVQRITMPSLWLPQLRSPVLSHVQPIVFDKAPTSMVTSPLLNFLDARHAWLAFSAVSTFHSLKREHSIHDEKSNLSRANDAGQSSERDRKRARKDPSSSEAKLTTLQGPGPTVQVLCYFVAWPLLIGMLHFVFTKTLMLLSSEEWPVSAFA